MSDEFKLQWSVSLAPVAQYAKGHMFNFRANTVDELDNLFDSVLNSETLDKALSVAELLTAAGNVKGNTGAAQSEPAASSADDGATVTQLRTCAHGKRTRREGNGKRGPWVGYFCPLPKGDSNQCDPVWED